MRAPDVARELAWRLRGNPHATAPGHDGKIYRSDLDNLVAAWSEVLFADALGAMYLGPAYLQALMKLSENERTRNRIGIDHHRGSIHEKPPLLVRETFVVRMLEQLGLGESAERVMYQWYRDEAPADALMLPVGQKQFAKVPMSALDGALEPFLTQLKQSSWETLGGKRLVSLKNLVFSGSMNESARAMTPRALRGQDLKTDPRSRMAVAVLAEAEDVTAVRQIWAAVDGVAPAAQKRRQASGSDEDSAGSFEDQLREAVIWREILLPRPGTMRARYARFQP